MRLSELSAETGVSTASLKFYLREGLLTPGEPLSRTQADYGTTHVDRVRLIRALVDSGGLSLGQVRQIIEALDCPSTPRSELFGVAQKLHTATEPVIEDPDWTTVAQTFVAERDWRVKPDDPLLQRLGTQLKALVESCGDFGDVSTLNAWADAAETIARADVGLLPDDDAQALKIVVVGTVLSDGVLQTLRRLAQQDCSARRFGSEESESAEPGAGTGTGSDQTESPSPDSRR